MNDPLLDRIRNTLDRSVEDLDGATRSKLNRARQQALEIGLRPRRRLWIPLTGAAATAGLALAVGVALRVPPPSSVPVDAAGDLELLASEDLEMMADLDFYLWLGEELEDNG